MNLINDKPPSQTECNKRQKNYRSLFNEQRFRFKTARERERGGRRKAAATDDLFMTPIHKLSFSKKLLCVMNERQLPQN